MSCAGLLHWFCGPYVHRLSYEQSTDTLDVTTLNILAQPVRQRLHMQQLRPPEGLRPQATFQVCPYVSHSALGQQPLLADGHKERIEPRGLDATGLGHHSESWPLDESRPAGLLTVACAGGQEGVLCGRGAFPGQGVAGAHRQSRAAAPARCRRRA